MAVTISLRREYELTGNDRNADPCLFPRFPTSATFVDACNFRTSTIADTPGSYDAFPDGAMIGGTLFVLFSRGPAHAQSSSQWMARSDDGGNTWYSVEFVNDANPNVYNTSLLEGLLQPGEKIVFKVYTISNNAGVISVADPIPFVSDGVTNYAVWGPARSGAGITLRSGYAAGKAAVLFSADGGSSWSYRATVFEGAGLLFSEFDLVNTGGTNWTAICREDSGAGNPLYISRTTDNGMTWSAPVLIPTTSANGRQPNLLRLPSGTLILATGDRAGVTGLAGNGEMLFGADITGITLVASTDNGATWGFRTTVAGMFSTDGGQPRMLLLSATRVICLYYSARSTQAKTGVRSATLDTVVL